ncbi:hypothetical protein EJB05_18701, partial [Eragrostis curvula]
MGEDLVTTLSMENGGPCTLLSMDPTGHLAVPDDRAVGAMVQALIGGAVGARAHSGAAPPDINQPWQTDLCDMLGVGLGPQVYTAEAVLSCAPKVGNRKAAKRSDSIWGAWFFFTFYFKPLLLDRCKDKVVRDANGVSGFDKSDLQLDMFLVQHDMENMYMWVFKERPENALGKMQLRSYMNGHQRPGEPQFPFSADRGFVRSHRMQRKHYRGLSNPQCIHGIELVRSPNLAGLTEADLRRWAELTGRDVNFVIPQEASDFGTWRTMPNSELELERPQPAMKSNGTQNQKKQLNGSGGLNLSSPSNHSGEDGMDLSPVSSKRRKEGFPHAMDEECFLPLNSCTEKTQKDVEMQSIVQPSWLHDFTGVMTNAFGPVTAAKSIYEDDKGYLIMVSLPFVDQQRVKVSWRNSLTHGIVKVVCTSTARMPHIRRHGRAFKLADPSPEHCPPGDFIREIPLATRIPEDAKLEAYFDEAASVLEIMVPKRGNEPEEHEVRLSVSPSHDLTNLKDSRHDTCIRDSKFTLNHPPELRRKGTDEQSSGQFSTFSLIDLFNLGTSTAPTGRRILVHASSAAHVGPSALVHLRDDGVADALQLLHLVFKLVHLCELVAVQPADGSVNGVLNLLLVLRGELGGDLVVLDGVPHVVGVVLQPVLGFHLLLELLVLRLVLLSLLHHLLDLLLAEPTLVVGDRDLVLLPGGLVLSRDVEDAIGIDVEADSDLGHAARCRRDARQLELAEEVVVLGPGALTLVNLDQDAGLVVGVGGEDLFLLGGDGGVPRDEHDPN